MAPAGTSLAPAGTSLAPAGAAPTPEQAPLASGTAGPIAPGLPDETEAGRALEAGAAPQPPQPDLPDLPAPAAEPLLERGLASWYGPKFHGRRTASGERYDMHGLTAAHKTLPLGSRVRVRSVHTGKEVIVRINDRGPYAHQRVIDLSQAAASALGVRQRGVSMVELLRE